MGLVSARKLICDICTEDIVASETFIDARVYGKTAHLGCFEGLKAAQVLRFLELDDVLLANAAVVLDIEHDSNATKAWASRLT